MGWIDGMDGMGYQKYPSIFFILCTYENERRSSDQMCCPLRLCGPVVFYAPKVPSLFFIISRKMSKTSLKKKVFFNRICAMPIFEIFNYDDIRFVSYYIFDFRPLYQRRLEFSEAGWC